MVNVICQLCGKEFEAKRRDAKWCVVCRVIKRRETYRRTDQKVKYNTCPKCGMRKFNRSEHCRSCSRKAELNNFWKGGRFKTKRGYVYIYSPDHPRANRNKGRYIAEHQLVWEKANNQILPDDKIIHHLNGVPDDNRPENLMAISRHEHSTRTRVAILEQRIRDLESQLNG